MEARRVAAEKPARLLSQRDSNMQAHTEVQEAQFLHKPSSEKGMDSGMVQMALLQLGRAGKPPQCLIPSSQGPV